ncbi:hypothetical protein [Tetragenococcus halophilus]|uniref:hypothetical protein n=1 Tax=Tetragenococcus halophilus TaxID=51669 RepID=UPI0030105E39
MSELLNKGSQIDTEGKFVRIHKLDNGKKTKMLWYYNYQTKSFPLMMNTKKGYLVKTPGNDHKWLVRKEHADIVSVDEIV